MTLPINQIICGDCLGVMKGWPDGCVDCCVTSPPYWGLRDYGVAGQLGLEKTPEEYLEKMVAVFHEVKRVLTKRGTLWLNMGDSYSGGGRGCNTEKQQSNRGTRDMPKSIVPGNLKPKDLCGMPWRLALALQADGWWLRQDIIWHKPNPMPESVTDRCTKAHEYLFLMTKSAKYYYDADAIREPAIESNTARPRMGQGPNTQYNQKRNRATFRGGGRYVNNNSFDNAAKAKPTDTGMAGNVCAGRNKRSVWTIPTQSCPDAHFATFPERLVEPCILAGCPKQVCRKCGKPRERIVEKGKLQIPSYREKTQPIEQRVINDKGWNVEKGFAPNCSNSSQTIGWTRCGHNDYRPGIVFDPFGGSGTVGKVAARLKRDYVLIELNPEYVNDIAAPKLSAVETAVPVSEAKTGQLALFGDKS